MDYPLNVNPAWAVPVLLLILVAVAWKLGSYVRADDDDDDHDDPYFPN